MDAIRRRPRMLLVAGCLAVLLALAGTARAGCETTTSTTSTSTSTVFPPPRCGLWDGQNQVCTDVYGAHDPCTPETCPCDAPTTCQPWDSNFCRCRTP